MENTQSIYIESANETWEITDALAIKLDQYKTEHPEETENEDGLYLAWFNTLSAEEKQMIQKHTPPE